MPFLWVYVLTTENKEQPIRIQKPEIIDFRLLNFIVVTKINVIFERT
jgi:hypothetical protein